MKSIQQIGLSAIIAASAAVVLCLGGPGNASAAEEGVAIPKFLDYMKKGKRSEAELTIGTTQAEISSKIESLSAMLASIQDQANQAEALQAEISRLMGELETAQASESEVIDSYLHQLDDGLTVFNEQVAPLLSEELVSSILKEIEYARTQLTATATFSDGTSSDVTERMGGLEGSFGNLKASIEEIMQQAGSLDTAVKASWNLKENVK